MAPAIDHCLPADLDRRHLILRLKLESVRKLGMSAKKRALVLGNGAYSSDSVLRSPRSDAKSVNAALRQINFTVTPGVDLTYEKMRTLTDEFIDLLRKERPEVALFYYSGHGWQNRGKNYLIPVDFDDDPNQIKVFPLQGVIDQICEFSSLQIVLLDACRSDFNPLTRARTKAIRLDPGKSIPIDDKGEHAAGLAEMTSSGSTFIAFAAAPGDVAYDGTGDLSPFTEAFVKLC